MTSKPQSSNPATEGHATEYVLGIDTGGTYTDGVLLDYHSRKVISFSKTLTTHADLTLGITKVLQDLYIKDPAQVRLVGVSSTLATNSIAEGKNREVGLLLLGYDPELIAGYGLQFKFPTRRFAYVKGGHTSQGTEKEPLDVAGIKSWVVRHRQEVDALAVSGYFSPLNPAHEERALMLIHEICSLPVVLGHQLSTKLDSIKRATTACLNASLVAVMQEFIEAVRQAIAQRGIHAPLMIVKGDGSLMPYSEAVNKPVETVLSGPAASAIGGRFLSKQGNALVIDIGGTTTDLALIENFKVTVSEDGARVGKFETAVEAARIRTAGIGCDSRIYFDAAGEIRIGPERIVPLCRLASWFPRVEQEIGLLEKNASHDRKPTDIEYWFLAKSVASKPVCAGPRHHRNLLELLVNGPVSLTRILERRKSHHVVQLNADPLIQTGVIAQANLTPTDLLHVNGQMNQWSAATARNALKHACLLYHEDPDTFVGKVFDRMVADIVKEAIVFLALQSETHRLPENIEEAWGRWFIEQAISGTNPYLAITMASRYPVIGIGAPASIFIKRVAQALQARFILPDHAAVANAVGAVAGSVIVTKEALVYARETDTAVAYVVQIEEESKRFAEAEDASTYAENVVTESARKRAMAIGAANPQIILEKKTEGALLRILARAVGNPKLFKPSRDYDN